MLDHDTRTAILRLAREGHGVRTIARAMDLSKNTVKRILKQGTAEVPKLERAEKAEDLIEDIRALHDICRGNLVRVHEELAQGGHRLAYTTLTAFCRRHHIGYEPPRPAGHYDFQPGEEMQHDTSPHRVSIGGRERLVQCASLVLCYSRIVYAQMYPCWDRFEARVFLTDALTYLGGSARVCMVDNSSVIVAHGTGKNAVFAAELEALAHRFGFTFQAHELGDANRSARVERPFDYIERNFYPGRTFQTLEDANRQLRIWCDGRAQIWKKTLKAKPCELLAAERSALLSLPLHIPDVYEPHSRIVDLSGEVNLRCNRYSAPPEMIGRQLEAREYKDTVRLYHGPRLLATHPRLEPGAGQVSRLQEHRDAAMGLKARHKRTEPIPEERTLRSRGAEIEAFVEALRKHHSGRAVRALRRLHRLWLDYPEEALIASIQQALTYGLLDLDRLERMVLRHIAGEFFQLELHRFPEPGDDHHE